MMGREVDWEKVPSCSMGAGSTIIPLRPMGTLRTRVRDRESRETTISFIATMLSGILREEDVQHLHLNPHSLTFNYDNMDDDEEDEDEEDVVLSEEGLVND